MVLVTFFPYLISPRKQMARKGRVEMTGGIQEIHLVTCFKETYSYLVKRHQMPTKNFSLEEGGK
jgi:hypothetical protein